MAKLNAETTKKNLEDVYGGKWIIMQHTIICPALEMTFSINSDGSLYPEDADRLSNDQFIKFDKKNTIK